MARDPRLDPQPDDVLYLGGALRRRVLEADGARVAWKLEGGRIEALEAGRVRVTSLAHWRRTFAPKPAGGQEELGDLDWDDAPLGDA